MSLKSLFISIAAISLVAISTASAQTATYWILTSSAPGPTIITERIEEPGTMTSPLLGGGAFADTGPGYAWMEVINAVVGAPGYSPGTNRGRLNFKIDRIDFNVVEPTSVLLTSEFFFEGQGIANAQLNFQVEHRNSSGSLIAQINFMDRGYIGGGSDLTSTPQLITINPGDYLRIPEGTLELIATTYDLNSNGFENPGDTFYSRMVASFGLKIETEAEFVSLLGGTYTGAMPLTVPEPSTYALMFGFLGLAFAVFRRRNKR